MPVRRDTDGRWRYREWVKRPDGSKIRINGTSPKDNNTKAGAQDALAAAIEEIRFPDRKHTRKECPTFEDWFNGRFWDEWVIAERNKPSERAAKECAFRVHLQPIIGKTRLDDINAATVQQIRAALVAKKIGDKRINNVMAVLSKALRYAVDAELIDHSPKIRFRKTERPEIEAWDWDEYARILASARVEGPEWYAAVCLAGEAGLRVGEVRALRWREDVDLVSGHVTVNQQSWKGQVGTPKGRTRRTIPMTDTLLAALKALEVVRTGNVIRNPDGTPIRDAQTSHATYRICVRAGLPKKGWHTLRHCFGTHAALLGINPWTLMSWMGHKRIDETMGYVHVAERSRREIPETILRAAENKSDPNHRVVAMLGARAKNRTNSSAASDELGMMSGS